MQPVSPSEQTRRLLGWYLAIRLAVVVFFLGGAIVYHLRSRYGTPPALILWLGGLVTITGVQTIISALLLPRLRESLRFIHLQLTWDLVFALMVIHVTGGVESPHSFLFILIIVGASVFLPAGQLLVVASAAAIFYGSLLDLQYYRFLPLFAWQTYPDNVREIDVFYAVFTNVGAFFLTALLAGYLGGRLRRSEAARDQREIDYGELEQLNRAILANITSGLMVVNPSGRIRSFNQAAAKLSGYRLEEVYNRPIEVFFPPFGQISRPAGDAVQSGEVRMKNRRGDALILGYSTSRLLDGAGSEQGVLIAFRDLTEIKALEEQLRRADRLTAVGRLAAGLAHEIRNPLASISGSVQLLHEESALSADDRRLLGIVLKEVDRLNLLLSDFLDFARPAPLQLDELDVATLLDELAELLRLDGMTAGIRIEQEYPRPLPLLVDRRKIRQVLWDLLRNAVQAVPPGGIVRIGCRPAERELYVEDSGPGIDEAVRERIFEPFFTTRESGTGLGLANAYANIEAHHGQLQVERGALGGACFVIRLPKECQPTT